MAPRFELTEQDDEHSSRRLKTPGGGKGMEEEVSKAVTGETGRKKNIKLNRFMRSRMHVSTDTPVTSDARLAGRTR